MKTTRATALALATGLTAAAVAAPATSTPVPGGDRARGSVTGAAHVQHLSAAQVTRTLRHDGFDASRVRYGVDAYRLEYRTIDAAGRPTSASGLVVLPRDGRRRLRAVSYAHGTMAGRDEAPSVDSGGRSAEGFTFASAGYAAVEPDYLGLGTGPGRHPYLQLASEVSAQLDMLRAARAFAAARHRPLDPRTLVTGFSQGGAAAMAFGKALQHGADPHLRLAGDAAISGPYALTTQELPAALDGRLDPKAAAYYLAYVLVAYNRAYHLYGHASEVFRAPYDRTVAPLYDGKHDDAAIFAALPASPRQLLTPRWFAALQHPHGRLLATLRDNQTACTGWRAAPIHLYAAHGDDEVTIGNSYRCQRQLADDGADSSLIDTGDVKHPQSGMRGLADTLRWFEHLAPPSSV